MKLGLFILASLVLFTSCLNRDCKKLDLSKEEMEWFENYENGDSVFFVNQVNEIDTFVIDVYQNPDYTVCNRFELGEYIYSNMSLQFNSCDNYPIKKMNQCYYIGFDKVGQDTSDSDCNKGLSFFDLSVSEFLNFDLVPKEDYQISQGGKKISVLVYTKNNNCSNVEGGTEIMQQFAISKEYGLVWYKTLTGDLYERVWKR